MTSKSNQPARPRAAKASRSDLARIVVLPGESRRRFDALLHALQDEHLPATVTERLLVGRMVVAQWRQLRAWALERATISNDTTHDSVADANARDALTIAGQARSCAFLSYYEARCDRQSSRALQCLIDLRAARAARPDAPKNGAEKNISGEKPKI